MRGQENAQCTIQSWSEFLDNHFDQLYHGCDNRDEHDEAQEAQVYSGVCRINPSQCTFFEHVVFQQVVDGNRDAQDEDNRKPEAIRSLHSLGNRELRTHAQEVGKNHVFNEDALHKYAEVFH